ncbi:MAG: hypothetical protein U9Q07_08390 [Planctomycetota bacterium]|nr:hypothetical protein [Planctomycetota bacterium]
MMLAQTAKSVGSLAAVLLLFGSGARLCNAKDGKSTLGKLRLDGEYIERLVLRRNDGHTEVLNDPEETVKLPAGQYLLQDVRLKGGYTRQTIRAPHSNRITISKDKPALLKVGGPLKQTVSVRRRGSILELTYGLFGADGNTYAIASNRNKRPTFAIYKGHRKIVTGKFEFG